MLAIEGAYGPRIHTAGDGRLRKDNEQPIGRLPFWRIIAPIDGTLTIHRTNGKERYEPGSVFIQHPGRHYDLRVSKGINWTWVTFDAVVTNLDPLPQRNKRRSSARCQKITVWFNRRQKKHGATNGLKEYPKSFAKR